MGLNQAGLSASSAGGGGAAGAMTLIASSVLSSPAASFSFANIPGSYNHLRLIFNGASSFAAETDSVTIQLNADSGANYDRQSVQGINVTASAASSAGATSLTIAYIPGASAQTGAAGVIDALFPVYTGTTFRKTITAVAGYNDRQTAAADALSALWVFDWRSTSAITSMVLSLASAANFITGSAAYLYGIN